MSLNFSTSSIWNIFEPKKRFQWDIVLNLFWSICKLLGIWNNNKCSGHALVTFPYITFWKILSSNNGAVACDGRADRRTQRQTDIIYGYLMFVSCYCYLNALKFTEPAHGDHEMSLSENSARFLVCCLSSIFPREIDKTNKSILYSYLKHTLVHYTEHQIRGFFSHYICFYDWNPDLFYYMN